MIKTWKCNEESATGMQIGDSHASVVVGSGGNTNGLYVDESGTYLSGNISILASPEQIRMGGLWTMNSPWQLMFPSTMAFPIPTLNISPPITGITKMAECVSWAMLMLL